MLEPHFPEVLDATMLASYRCPRRFFYAHVHRYGSPGGKSIHLIAGGAYAKGLEVARLAYMNDKDPGECLLLGIDALIREYGDAQPGETSKSLDRMVGALEFYFDQYPLNTDPARIAVIAGSPAVEWSFALPLPFNHPVSGNPLLYTGRTDALMDFAGGLYGLDDKTTSQLGTSWPKQWTLRSQFTGYAWAARELGIPLAGTLVRGVSILKTKYDTAQAIVNQPPWKIDQWVGHRDTVIHHMLHDWRNLTSGAQPEAALDETCNEYGGCMFKQVCEVPPTVRDSWLATNYEEVIWNPLAKL